MKTFAAVFLALAAAPLAAQDFGLIETEELPALTLDRGELRPFDDAPQESALEVAVTSAPGAVLRGLDKVSGDITDLALGVGETVRFGRIEVSLGDCRFPQGNPAGDAYALVSVRADGLERPAFEGWMIASSPALSALDHPRYDVWVMRCSTS